ncbi:MAG: carbohydrate ABC transporter substrate-binding protein [Oscillospiraceae bacterium]|nr:carbohydrate ABC transporter substrate-binding protein [Oscillospiraceae bacterium]
MSRKTQLQKAVVASLILSLSSCNKSDDTGIRPVKTDNYYSGIYVDKIKDISYIRQLECTDDATYVIGALSELVCDKVIDIYDVKENKLVSIALKLDDCYHIDALYADDSMIYAGYRNSNSEAKAAVFNRFTGEKLQDIYLSADHAVYSIFKDSTGNIYFHMVNTSNLKLSSFTMMYDKSLDFQSEINLCEKLNLPEGRKPVRFLSDGDGGYYVTTLDTSDSLSPSVYKISGEFSVQYCIDDFSDMSGEIENLCINPDKNLLVIFKDSESNYFINEIDSKTGKVSERYECTFEPGTFLTGNLLNSPGQSSSKYDFCISENDGIYGYDLKTGNTEKICDYSCKEPPDCLFSESDSLLMYQSQAGNNDFSICKIDNDGNVTERDTFRTNDGGLGDVFVNDRNELYFSEVSGDYQINICNKEKTLYTITTDECIDYIHSIYTDSDDCFHIGYVTVGNDAENTYFNYIVCNKDGNTLYSKKVSVNSHTLGIFPSHSGDTFKMLYTDTENKLTVETIDYKTKKETKSNPAIKTDDITEFYKGTENFDFCYSTGDSVCGYSESEKKAEEIIDWNDSQIYVNPDIVRLKDDDSFVCTTLDENTLSENLCILNKADKETVEKLKNRKSLNLTVFNATENLKKAVNRYNNSNMEYLININEIRDAAEFSTDVISNENPDIVLWNSEIDMSTYLRNGFFTNLNTFLSKDENISFDDLLGNICNSVADNRYIPIDFKAEALIYDKSEWDTDTLTYDALINFDKENIFFDMTQEELLGLLVTDNINRFVDFENKETFFDTETFSDILKFIKENSANEKFQIITTEDFKEANRRFKDDRCFLEKTVLSVSELLRIKNQVLDDFSLFGFPGKDGMYSEIIPETLAGISEKSENKEASWDFLSFLLSSSYQDDIADKINGLFPVNKESFEKARKSMYDDKNNNIVNMLFDYVQNKCGDFVSDEHILQIVTEQAELFFKDAQNIEDTIKNIDNRARLYLNEI